MSCGHIRHGFGDEFASYIGPWTHLLPVFAHLNPHSSDFGDICALYSPFLHQLTMQSSLFKHLRPCPSYSRRNLGLLRSFYKGGGPDPAQHAKGRTGDCPGPRKETTTRRNVTRGVKVRYFAVHNPPPSPGGCVPRRGGAWRRVRVTPTPLEHRPRRCPGTVMGLRARRQSASGRGVLGVRCGVVWCGAVWARTPHPQFSGVLLTPPPSRS